MMRRQQISKVRMQWVRLTMWWKPARCVRCETSTQSGGEGRALTNNIKKICSKNYFTWGGSCSEC